MNEYYILKGKKVIKATLMEWAEWSEKSEKRIIKQEELPNGKWVSTVFLGLNHQFGEGKPLIFETMVFPKNGNYMDLDMERYSTYKEAEKGHKKMVNKWREI